MSDEHIEENRLEQYAMDVLPEQSRAVVDEHLLECADCQSRLVQLDAFLDAFRPAVVQMRKQPAVKRLPLRLFPRLVWLGSAAALAASLLFLILRPGAPPIAPAIIEMQALRGPQSAARLPAGQPALLVFDIGGKDQTEKYEVEVVDPSGKAVWTAAIAAKGDRLRVPIRKLDPGSYWLRVYREQPDKRLMEEYALRVAKP